MKFKRLLSLLPLAALLCLLCLPASAASAPVLEVNPASPVWPENSVAYWTCTISDGDAEFYDYRWFIVYQGTTYDACDSAALASQPWYQYGDPDLQFGIGPMENSYYISGIKKGLDGAQIYCTAENANGSVVSSRAVIRVTDSTEPMPPENLSMTASYTVEQGEELVLTCKATKAYNTTGSLHHLWYQSASGSLTDIQAVNRGSETNATLKVDTSTPGVMTYYCGVYTDGGTYENNFSFTGAITVEVLEKETVEAIEVRLSPDKLLYEEGETLDLKGLKLRVTTSMGYYDLTDLSEVTAEPEILTGAGKHTVTVTYQGATAEFEVEVENIDPECPTIDVQPEGGVFTIGEEAHTLTVRAHVEDGGQLTYAWYSCTDGNRSSATPIRFAASDTLTLTQEEGTVYYCVYIWNELDGLESEPAISDLIPITFLAAEEEEPEETAEEEIEEETEEETVTEFVTAGKTEEETETAEPALGEVETKKKTSSMLPIILFLIVVLLAIGGGAFLIVWMILKEKKSKQAPVKEEQPRKKATMAETAAAQHAAAAARTTPATQNAPVHKRDMDATMVLNPDTVTGTPVPNDLSETVVLNPEIFDAAAPEGEDELNLTQILEEFSSDTDSGSIPDNPV